MKNNLVDLFTEKNAEYYKKVFSVFSEKDDSSISKWNWGAAFGGSLWLLYRKMIPEWLVLLVSVNVTVLLAFQFTYVAENRYIFYIVLIITIRIILGLWGNWFYYRRFMRISEKSKNYGITEKEKIMQVKGGLGFKII